MAGNDLSPKEAADVLYAASNAAPLNKPQHMQCEQAKMTLDVALKRLQELAKGPTQGAAATEGVEHGRQ